MNDEDYELADAVRQMITDELLNYKEMVVNQIKSDEVLAEEGLSYDIMEIQQLQEIESIEEIFADRILLGIAELQAEIFDEEEF